LFSVHGDRREIGLSLFVPDYVMARATTMDFDLLFEHKSSN